MPDHDSEPDEATPGEAATADAGATEKAETAETGETAKEAEEGPAPTRSRARTAVPAAVVAAALALLVVALVLFVRASDDPDYAADARVRDEVQVEAANAVEVLNTLDARDLDTGLEAWASVSTGDLQSQLTDLTDQQRQALTKVAGISEGEVVSSAVTRLDADAGTASVIAFVEKRTGKTPTEVEQATPSRIQFTVELKEQDGTWLVSTLTPISVITPEGEAAQ